MFDQSTPPSNLPTGQEPEDMFGAVEPVPTPPPFPTTLPSPLTPLRAGGEIAPPPSPAPEPPAEIKAPLVSSRKVIVIGGVVLGVLIVGGVAYGVLKFVRQAAAPAIPPQEIPIPAELVPLPAPVVQPLPPSSPPELPPSSSLPLIAPPPLDTDGDGLTDEEETALGTQANNPDSDTDGLFDNEEVKTYQTDPLKSDTDGDTYLDGQEVRAGYNPKGAGKLFTVPSGQ